MVVSMILMISGNSDTDGVSLHGTDTSDYDECRVTCGEGQCYCSVVHEDEDLDMNGCLKQIWAVAMNVELLVERASATALWYTRMKI